MLFRSLLHQGTKLFPADFIGFKESLYGNTEHHSKLMANFYAQTQALAEGKTKEEAHLDLKMQGKMDEIETLLPYKVFEGNKPSTSILITKLTPKTLGSLIAFYEHKIFVRELYGTFSASTNLVLNWEKNWQINIFKNSDCQ